jgi:eukaryotic-like serine/threonine-protein kinase
MQEASAMMTTPSPSPQAETPSEQVARLAEEMATAWKRGERPRAEEILERNPGLRDVDAIRIVYEEACLRLEDGEDPASTESQILRRFPRWRSELALLLDCNRLLWAAATADFPAAGDDLGDFRLLTEIGRGAVGRTYLASQHSLAHRLVVLKVVPVGHHDEHLSLARLQHMNIVPLYFEQVFADRNLRVMGMPYLGGATLARLLVELAAIAVPHRTGAQVLDALDRAAVALPAEEPLGGPFRKYLAQASYVQAVCWIGACLADALQYAHDRGLVHLDVKASNVLIAGDGQPMLLDFSLAGGPVAPGLAVPDRLGGTTGHLSPEQERAMAALRAGQAVHDPVDGRSDIYSLGLLLYEALGGAAGAPLERCNPRVSPGLSDVVARCLARDPADRYPDAALLALDLRRYLSDLPFRGVPNRSLAERWLKWRRRQPAALTRGVIRGAVLATIAAGLLAAFVALRQRNERIETALREGNEYLANRQYGEAVTALNHGLAVAEAFPVDEERRQPLKESLRRALRARTVAELHKLVEQLRFRSGVGPPALDDEAGAQLGRALEVWAARDRLTAPDEPVEPEVRADLIDLATLCADLRANRAAGRGTPEAIRDAIQILRDAEALFGPSPALSRDLRTYAKALGQTAVEPSSASAEIEIPAPRTAWEHYDLGRSYLRSGEYDRAESEFQRAVEMHPGEFWPYFSEGICAYRLKRYEAAVSAFTICVALAPRIAPCYYNRALAYQAHGEAKRALADYTRALEIDARFTDAALNRGILNFHEGRPADALLDFDLALSTTSSRQALGLIHYNAALVYLSLKDRASARSRLVQAIAHGDEAARRLLARLEAE